MDTSGRRLMQPHPGMAATTEAVCQTALFDAALSPH